MLGDMFAKTVMYMGLGQKHSGIWRWPSDNRAKRWHIGSLLEEAVMEEEAAAVDLRATMAMGTMAAKTMEAGTPAAKRAIRGTAAAATPTTWNLMVEAATNVVGTKAPQSSSLAHKAA